MKVRLKDPNGIYEYEFIRYKDKCEIKFGNEIFSYPILKEGFGEILLHDRDKIYRLIVHREQGRIWVAVEGRSLVFNELGEDAPSGEIGMEDRDLTVKAPMPGTVIKILVSPGQRLKRGDPLAIVEAMKMENVVKCPGEAIVVKLLTQPGQQVGFGEELLQLAPPHTENASISQVD